MGGLQFFLLGAQGLDLMRVVQGDAGLICQHGRIDIVDRELPIFLHNPFENGRGNGADHLAHDIAVDLDFDAADSAGGQRCVEGAQLFAQFEIRPYFIKASFQLKWHIKGIAKIDAAQRIGHLLHHLRGHIPLRLHTAGAEMGRMQHVGRRLHGL